MLILASASPRRRSLLRLIEPRFAVRPASLPEVPRRRETPEAFAARMAREKALAVASALATRVHGGGSGALVLGADTVVALGAAIFGKPRDSSDARRMLRRLSGKKHRVITGVAVWRASDERLFAGRSVTQVVFDRMTAERIEAYVASGEPMDAAGAYQIQGRASAFIPRIEGSYSNVVGFPLDVVARLLELARRRP